MNVGGGDESEIEMEEDVCMLTKSHPTHTPTHHHHCHSFVCVMSRKCLTSIRRLKPV